MCECVCVCCVHVCECVCVSVVVCFVDIDVMCGERRKGVSPMLTARLVRALTAIAYIRAGPRERGPISFF